MTRKISGKIGIALVLILFFESFVLSQMSNREWWNSLSPAWKKVFYKEQFKGKEIEPNDEDLDRVVKTRRINCSNNKEIAT